jgi:predicted permease
MRLFLEDVRYAVRALAKRPLHAIVISLVLALAIGANTTVFSVLNAFYLRPLPYPEGERLVLVYDSYRTTGIENAGTAIPDYIERREQAPSLESLAIFATAGRTLSGDGTPERLLLVRASPSMFDVLRTAPAIGRAFTDDEATVGNDRVIVLSHPLWSRRFGAQRDIVGRDIRLDGDSFRVIGVMPEGFGYPNRDVDAWLPFAFTPQQMGDAGRGNQFSVSVGRLRPGATIDGLNAELAAIVSRNVAEGRLQPDAVTVAGFTGRAQALRDNQVGDLAQMLLLLQGIVGAVLLIACANVANLQLARVTTRRKELAVRAALGAAGARLVRLVLVESLVLALGGAALGLMLALGGIGLVRALGLDRASAGFDVMLDAPCLAFTLGTAIVAALVSGLPPVIALLRGDLTHGVREAGRQSGGGRDAHVLRGALVVAQLGMSLALLVGAGLLTKSFYALQAEGAGFDPSGIWTARIGLPASRYSGGTEVLFEQQALAALRALPGVAQAGFTSILPFAGNNDQGSTEIDGYVPPAGASPPHAQHRSIDEGYLPTLGIPVIAGRNFDAIESEPVVIVDENVAQRYWPTSSALGQRVRREAASSDVWSTIIGVVPAVKHTSLAEDPLKETMYWHYSQRPMPTGAFVLRTMLPPEQITRVASAAIAQLDPELALSQPMAMDVRLLSSMGPQRTPMVLTLVFAGIAFTLAVIGIYGVLSWAVTQRVGEIGVRMALGARSLDIVRMILKQGARTTAIGLVIGAAAAIGLGRVLASQIPEVGAFDPALLVLAIVGLGGAALFATWLPARRAAQIDPMRALRDE